MPTTFSKQKLSGSTDGKAIKLTTTGSPGDVIHTAHATSLDEIWAWVYNSDTVDREVTFQFGGTTSPDNDIKVTIGAKQGKALVIPGLILTNSLVVRAFGAAANVLTVTGFVNRIT